MHANNNIYLRYQACNSEILGHITYTLILKIQFKILNNYIKKYYNRLYYIFNI